jgi:rfaE bifunctional protein kinase chain/domain
MIEQVVSGESKFAEIIKKFNNKKIGVVGDVLLDSYLFGKISRINPERPGYPLLRIERQEHRLGGAGNVAANLVSLGANVILFGAIGEDLYGSLIKKRCRKLRIKFVPVIEGKTLLKQRRIESTHNDYLGREDFGEAKLEKLSQKGERKLFKAIVREKPQMLIFSDYNKKIFSGGFAKRLIQWAKSEGIPTVVDPKPTNIDSFKGAMLVSPNLKEAKEIVGKDHENKNVKDIVGKVREIVKSKYVAVTCGSEGVVSYDGEFHYVPADNKELTDVTGAGDVFMAALSLSILCDANLLEASQIASCAAGISVEKLGASSVKQKELTERICQSTVDMKI